MDLFDSHTMTAIVLTAFLGGFIGLDRTALGQFMVSQPVVAGPLVGWLLGDPRAGLVTGGALELVWVLDMPIGTFVPADATVATVAATAIAAIGGGGRADLPVIGFSLLLTTVMIPGTMLADHLMRQRNARIPQLVLDEKGLPSEARITGWHLAGLIAFFLKSFILCLVLVPAGLAVLPLFVRLPEPFHIAMVPFISLLPLLGVAAMTRKLSMQVLDRFLTIGFVVAVLCVSVLGLPAPAAVSASALGGWVGARYGRA
ncbi:MAG: PTS sugar transporter subunit IIC [Nitrospiraceae bacterium]|nr:PTS sugar transporter subunit IIC [Nitrospiraceae bacterium]